MSANEVGAQQVDVSQLPIPHLNHLSQQLEQELKFLTDSINQLKLAQGKFLESEDALTNLGAPGAELLVPLTSSMYVPGTLSEDTDLLVDIGTGYFVSMPKQKAQNFFKRKISYLTKNIEKVQPVLGEKYRTKQIIAEVLQGKVAAQLAEGGPGGAALAQS